jgi:hypothetical protein
MTAIGSIRDFVSDELEWEQMRAYAKDLCSELQIMSEIHGEKLNIHGRSGYPVRDDEDADMFMLGDFVISDNEFGSDAGVMIRLLTKMFEL